MMAAPQETSTPSLPREARWGLDELAPNPHTIADTISVLQRGQVIAEGPYETVSKNPQVLEAYMGSADEALAGASHGH